MTVTYAHNAFGQRQIKDDGTTTTRFVYNGPNLLHEDNGSVERDYIYLDGELVAFVQSGTVYYVHNDHLGRPEKVTTSYNNVVWSSQNNAFDNVPVTDMIGGLNVGFPGQYYDVESGRYYNYFRTYDSETGRYLQSDPIGLAGGLNTYTYAGANPVNGIDPLGLFRYGTGVGTASQNPLIMNFGGSNGPNFTGPGADPTIGQPSGKPPIDLNCVAGAAYEIAAWLPFSGPAIAGKEFIEDPSWWGALDVVLSAFGPGGKGLGRILRSADGVPARIPGRVQSRINVSNDGFSHTQLRHFDGRPSKSQFSIGQDELRDILGDKNVIGAPVEALPSGQFVRQVDVGRTIGNLPINSGGAPTSIISIVTDEAGNLVSSFPGPLKY